MATYAESYASRDSLVLYENYPVLKKYKAAKRYRASYQEALAMCCFGDTF